MSAITKTGRPRLGAKMEVLAGDGETWLPVKVRLVGGGHDRFGQSVVTVAFEYLDDEGGVSPIVRWDAQVWREAKW